MELFKLRPVFLFAPDAADGGDPEPEKPEPDTEEAEPTTPEKGPDPAKNEKQFSQAEVDSMIKSRLAREKESASRALDAEKARGTAAEDELSAYKERMQKLTAERMEGMPEATRALLEKLDPLEQLDWLTDNPGAVVETPKTPKPEGPQGGRKGSEVKVNI